MRFHLAPSIFLSPLRNISFLFHCHEVDSLVFLVTQNGSGTMCFALTSAEWPLHRWRSWKKPRMRQFVTGMRFAWIFTLSQLGILVPTQRVLSSLVSISVKNALTYTHDSGTCQNATLFRLIEASVTALISLWVSTRQKLIWLVITQ